MCAGSTIADALVVIGAFAGSGSGRRDRCDRVWTRVLESPNAITVGEGNGISTIYGLGSCGDAVTAALESSEGLESDSIHQDAAAAAVAASAVTDIAVIGNLALWPFKMTSKILRWANQSASP